MAIENKRQAFQNQGFIARLNLLNYKPGIL